MFGNDRPMPISLANHEPLIAISPVVLIGPVFLAKVASMKTNQLRAVIASMPATKEVPKMTSQGRSMNESSMPANADDLPTLPWRGHCWVRLLAMWENLFSSRSFLTSQLAQCRGTLSYNRELSVMDIWLWKPATTLGAWRPLASPGNLYLTSRWRSSIRRSLK